MPTPRTVTETLIVFFSTVNMKNMKPFVISLVKHKKSLHFLSLQYIFDGLRFIGSF